MQADTFERRQFWQHAGHVQQRWAAKVGFLAVDSQARKGRQLRQHCCHISSCCLQAGNLAVHLLQGARRCHLGPIAAACWEPCRNVGWVRVEWVETTAERLLSAQSW